MQPVARKEIVGWAMYDWANSAFATTILSVVFSTYFTGTVVPKDGAIRGETLWNWANALSLAVVCAAGPLLGAITDYTASKKRLFVPLWLLGAGATAALGFVKPGDVVLGFVLFALANLGFGASVALNNAFLNELVASDKMDRVSSFGWAMGYLGGGICLALNLVIFRLVQDGVVAARLGFVLVGVWWFVFGLPCVLWVKERAVPKPRPPGASLVGLGFRNVWATLTHIRRYRQLFLFLLAYLVFNGGVETVISNAAIFGGTVAGMKTDQLVVCYLVIQIVAAGGAFLFGRLAERTSAKRVIALSLVVWLAVLAMGFFTTTPRMFWLLGIGVALVMGGTQALSRGFFAQLTPPEKSAEFFGFFAIAGKFSAAIAPLLFGTVTQLSGHMKWGIVSLAVFFVAGLPILLRVDEKAGRAEARGEGAAA